MIRSKLLLAVLLVWGSLISASAQAVSSESETAKQVKEKKALELLEQVLSQAQSLKLPENRILVKVMAAGMLWERDQPRARSFYQDAENDLRLMMQNLSNETGEERPRKIDIFNQFRQELLRNLARLDPQLALELLNNTRLPAELKRQYGGGYDPEFQLETEITAQATARDPAKAIKAVEDLLQKGFSHQLLNLADSFRRPGSDNRTATEIYQRIIQKLASDDILNSNEATNLAASLLQRAYGESQRINAPAPSNAVRAMPQAIDEQMFRQLIEMTTKAVATAQTKPTTDGNRVNNTNRLRDSLQSMLPAVERYAPAQAANLKSKAPAGTATPPNSNRATMSEFMVLANNPNTPPDQLIEFAKKAPAQEQNNLFTQAAMRTLSKGDAETARQIIETHVKDPQAKQNFERMHKDFTLSKAMRSGDIAEARRLLDGIQSPARKAERLTNLAMSVAAKGDKKEAESLLEEAFALFGNQLENVRQIQPLINLSRTFATIAPDRSFAILEAMTGKLNTVIAAASIIDEFEMRNGFQDGEVRFSAGGGLYYLNSFYTNLSYLATIDFDKAQTTAERFERPETRLNALLHVVTGVLRPMQAQQFGGMMAMPPPPPPPPPTVIRR